LLLLAGILLIVVPLDQGTVPQWNGLCSSGIGQLGQLLSPDVRAHCGQVGLADHAIGWLLGLGILGLAAGAGLAFQQTRPERSADPGQHRQDDQHPQSPPPGEPGGAGAPASPPVAHAHGGTGPAWLRSHAVVIAVVAAVAAGAGALFTFRAVAGGSGGLETFLCWNGPGDTTASMLQWPAGGIVAGTYRGAYLTGTAPAEQVTTDSGALSGTVSGPNVSLDMNGGGQEYGKLGTDLVLQIPQQDGTIQPVICKPAGTAAWNAAITNLSATAASDNQAAAQQQQQQQAQQQQQQVQQQISQAQSSLTTDLATLSQDASTQEQDKTLANDIQTMQTDIGTEQQDYATEQSDSCSYRSGDASTVDGDASTVDGDLSTLQGDISSLQSGAIQAIQSDIAAVQSDVATIQNLGGTVTPSPSSAVALGNKTLKDSKAAITWATSNGNSLDNQAHQIASQADTYANQTGC